MFEPGFGVVMLAARQHGPQLSRMLVGNGHQHLAKRKPSLEVLDPALFCRGLFPRHRLGTLQSAAGTLDQQGAQVAITTTADATQPRVAATGMLHRHQAQPRCELPAIGERLCRSDRRDYGVRRDRAHANDGAQPRAGFVSFGVRLDLAVGFNDPCL